MKADISELTSLMSLMDEVVRHFDRVTKRRMFGCDAFFVGGLIFALIWKTGRIGLKLPSESLFKQLMSASGSTLWVAGNKTMRHWVLIPETFHKNPTLLRQWAGHAYSLAVQVAEVPETTLASMAKPKSGRTGTRKGIHLRPRGMK
jgi:TfoX/Sxy family transcriptional regulator of competence genes